MLISSDEGDNNLALSILSNKETRNHNIVVAKLLQSDGWFLESEGELWYIERVKKYKSKQYK